METTAIKVNVTSDEYEIIKDIQKNLREKEGKKTSLAEIMLRLAQVGIESLQNEQEYGQNAQKNDNSAQNEDGFAHNSKHFTPESEVKSLIISSKESRSYDELSIRQEYLSDREAEIRDLEIELYDEREKLINKNRELLKLEEELLRKQYEMKYNSIERELISKIDERIEKVNFIPEQTQGKNDKNEFAKVFDKLSNIKELLSDIKRQTKQENFTKYLELLLENDDRIINLIEKGNQKTTLEKLEPLLPAALNAVVTFIMKNKQNNNSEELLKEIKALKVGKKKEDKK